MALFNEILAGRFNRFTQKHFSMKGRQGTPTLSADLQMGMDFNSGVENRYLEGWDMFGRSALTTAPGVGNASTWSARNPAASGVICVITRAAWCEAGATNAAFANQSGFNFILGMTADQNTAIAPTKWDSRSQRLGSSLITTFNSAAPAATGGTTSGLCVGSVPAFGFVDFIPPGAEIPVLPGSGVTLVAGNLNAAGLGVLWWRERALEESEKT